MTYSSAVLDVRPDPQGGMPATFALSSPFPNPTRGGTALSLALPQEAEVSMSVLDVQGREVWSEPAHRYAAGRWTLKWDGQGARGVASTGVYLVRVRAGSQVMLRRVALLH